MPTKRNRYTILEFAAVAFALIWTVFYNTTTGHPSVDFDIYLAAGSGRDMSKFFYGPWSLPFFYGFSLMPYVVARTLAGVISTLGFIYAINVFKGNRVMFFTSYALLFTIFYGQVEGVWAAGLALMYVGLKKDDPVRASVGWFIAITKFHVGIPLGFALWWLFASNWRIRFQIAAAQMAVLLVSLVIWPGWIPDLLARVEADRVINAYGFSLWDQFGPVLLLLWIPVVLSGRQDYRWWVAAWALTMPHFHIHYLSHLLMLPTLGTGWLVHLAYVTGYDNYTYLMLFPLALYLYSAWMWWKSRTPSMHETSKDISRQAQA